MELNTLTAISPIDGRYRNQLAFLDEYFSEYALIKGRVKVEVLYFLFLNKKKFFKLNTASKKALLQLLDNFSVEQAKEIKQIEATTNHDVKAVEYFIKNILKQHKETDSIEWVHFGLTSQDVNNTAIPYLLQQFCCVEYLPHIINLTTKLHQLAKANETVAMLARTHGQAASPTTLGKEIMVFIERLQNQIRLLAHLERSVAKKK